MDYEDKSIREFSNQNYSNSTMSESVEEFESKIDWNLLAICSIWIFLIFTFFFIINC